MQNIHKSPNQDNNIDLNSGLYYFNARWYDPTLGRFITEDPIKDGNNWFVYCSNNPINRIDPTGLKEDYTHNQFDHEHTYNCCNTETAVETTIESTTDATETYTPFDSAVQRVDSEDDGYENNNYSDYSDSIRSKKLKNKKIRK